MLTVLGDASNDMRTATNQRLVLEIAFTRIARPETELTLEALAERVADLERQGLAARGLLTKQLDRLLADYSDLAFPLIVKPSLSNWLALS